MIHAAVYVVAACLGLMFLAAAFGKADGWPRWGEATRAFFPSHRRLAGLLRAVIPASEVAVGLLTFVRPLVGLISGSVLLVTLTAGVLWLIPRSRTASCNCFGALMPSEIGPALAIRNVLLAAIAALAAIAVTRRGAPVFTPVEGLLLTVVGSNVLVAAELRHLPRQLLRGASEMKPRES